MTEDRASNHYCSDQLLIQKFYKTSTACFTLILLFAGLMSLHFSLFLKFSLWSFRVMNACFSGNCSILSSNCKSSASSLASWFTILMFFYPSFDI